MLLFNMNNKNYAPDSEKLCIVHLLHTGTIAKTVNCMPYAIAIMGISQVLSFT